MSIVKMKLVNVSANSENFEDMLIRCSRYAMLHAETANQIINEDNQGALLSQENVYSEYMNKLRTIGHSIGFNLSLNEKFRMDYTHEEITSFIDEVEESFKLVLDSAQSANMNSDDEAAIEILRQYDYHKMHECEFISFGLGRLPIENLKKLEMLNTYTILHYELLKTKQYVWIFYVTPKDQLKETQRIMENLFLEELSIPQMDSKKIIGEYQEKLNDVYSYVHFYNEIYKLHRYITVFPDNTYVLTGFVPASNIKEFKNLFVGMDVTVEVNDPEILPHIVPPTMLKSNWFSRPFEMFIDMYGLPKYTDLDPTIFVSITFCVLFGIMFGDVGQGLLLVIGGWYLAKKKKSSLAAIVSRAGIVSTICGFLYGSVFGNEEILGPVHEMLFGTEKLIHVMDTNTTMPLLIFAIGIGAFLILMTMIINMMLHIKRKDWGDLFFSQNGIAGFVFYGYILAGVAGMFVEGLPNLFVPLLMVLCLGIPLICFLLKEPLTHLILHKTVKPKQGWGGYFLEAIFEVLEILLSFITNTMSYLRVGGFVLSHAGMMLVVMTLRDMTGAAGIIVMIFGNLFVMGLEGLIVGIQTLRLEYYEMFSRYFEGGGKKFKMISKQIQ